MSETAPEPDVTFNETSIDGMRVLVAEPDGVSPKGTVVMFPHVGGLTKTMETMAGIVAGGGYRCLVPDLYHRLGRIVLDPESHDPDAVRIRQIAASTVTNETAMADFQSVLTVLKSDPGASGKVGTIGFGKSGWFAILAAATFPDEVAAAASVLGFGFSLQPEGEALDTFGRISCETYFAFAENDEIIPPDEPERVKALLARSPSKSLLVVHSGARHPYVFPDRAVHDPAAAARDWSAIFDMYGRALGV
ncbi:MAG: dienelactone hydrolase family protein [Rhodobiaceae bacterium]|nr:dienelactone hydrolase family protein [Rhodobiaceae bacterium]